LNNKEAEVLKQFVPENAIELMIAFQKEYPHQLKISRSRATKLGDYRPPQGKFNYHRISVNGDLNAYSFLITFIHEIAHLVCWEKHGRYVKPHGQEWKNIYKNYLMNYISKDCFPDDLLMALKQHLNNPSASSCVDLNLQKELAKYDDKIDGVVFIEELPINTYFVTRNGKLFKKLEKRRKRFKCQEVKTGKFYLFSPIAEVKEYEVVKE